MIKPLSEMTLPELHEEISLAHQARFSADYVEGLERWRAAVDGAELRIRNANAELERRLKHG